MFKAFGQRKRLSQWARESSPVKRSGLSYRIENGMSMEDALAKPKYGGDNREFIRGHDHLPNEELARKLGLTVRMVQYYRKSIGLPPKKKI